MVDMELSAGAIPAGTSAVQVKKVEEDGVLLKTTVHSRIIRTIAQNGYQ